MNDQEAAHFKKRAYLAAYRLLRNREDAEDVAHDVIASWLTYERKHGERSHQTVDQGVMDALDKRFGRPGTKRYEFSHAERRAESIDEPGLGDGLKLYERLGTLSHDPREDEDFGTRSRIDPELIERSGEICRPDERGREEAHRLNVTESRVSQIRRKRAKSFVRKYLWEHYKENGIETDLEVEWLTI